MINIDSMRALFLAMSYSGQRLATGTGFMTKCDGRWMLITNRHNVTGRHQGTGECLDKVYSAVPNELTVYVPVMMPVDRPAPPKDEHGAPGWRAIRLPLYGEDGASSWVEHPELEGAADMVALPFRVENDMLPMGYTGWWEQSQVTLSPADRVNVIGFPFGLSGTGKFGIWVTGFVASEPDLNFNGLPVFLIDARTRKGQSGSPVTANGQLLGIYSGRINEESDLGMVWKATEIAKLVQHAASLSALWADVD